MNSVLAIGLKRPGSCLLKDAYFLCLSDDSPSLSNGAGEVSECQYRGKEFFLDFLKRQLGYSDSQALFCFSNQLYLNFFYPVLKRIELVSRLLDELNPSAVHICGSTSRSLAFPIVGAEGDVSGRFPWDKSVLLSYVALFCKQKDFEVVCTFRKLPCNFIRAVFIFYGKRVLAFFLFFVWLLSRLKKKKCNFDRSRVYVVRDFRTLEKFKPEGTIIFNPSFISIRNFSGVKKLYSRSVLRPKLYYSWSRYRSDFSGTQETLEIYPGFFVDTEVIEKQIYFEAHDKLLYYHSLAGMNLSFEEVVTPEIVNSNAFLESKALGGESILAKQTFALDPGRTLALPFVGVREYLTARDRDNFGSIETADTVVVNSLNYVPVQTDRSIKKILFVTQPNFSISSSLADYVQHLRIKRPSIDIVIKIHPRDYEDYTEFSEYLVEESIQSLLPCCDLVVGKTSFVLHESLEHGIPIVICDAGGSLADLPYLRFLEGVVSTTTEFLDVVDRYSAFLAEFSRFQQLYFEEKEDS